MTIWDEAPGMTEEKFRDILKDVKPVVATADLPAGRELDALVAELVMGLKVCRLGRECPDSHYDCSDVLEAEPGDDNCIEPYSTDIGAAWAVVEAVGGAFVELLRYEDPVRYVCTFGDKPLDYDGAAPTAPLAICRAALA